MLAFTLPRLLVCSWIARKKEKTKHTALARRHLPHRKKNKTNQRIGISRHHPGSSLHGDALTLRARGRPSSMDFWKVSKVKLSGRPARSSTSEASRTSEGRGSRDGKGGWVTAHANLSHSPSKTPKKMNMYEHVYKCEIV